jgi:DNA-binding ferritin-like protein
MTDLTTLSHMLETGVAGPEAQAAAGAEITRLRKQVKAMREALECLERSDDRMTADIASAALKEIK